MNRDKTIFLTHTLQLSICYVLVDTIKMARKYQWYCNWIKDGQDYKLIPNLNFDTEKEALKHFRKFFRRYKGKTYHYMGKTYRMSYRKGENK